LFKEAGQIPPIEPSVGISPEQYEELQHIKDARKEELQHEIDAKKEEL
jgi:hypothetical protein